MTREWRRRDILRVLGGSVAAAACTTGPAKPPPCIVVGSETGRSSYCLVGSEVLRVPSVRTLALGQAILFNVDDSTAVVIVRDDTGFYAMSGICTHQCCLVALCADSACIALGTNPGECGTTPTEMPARTGAAIVCPCHGSQFAIDGTVLTGPAVRALPHYALTFDGDDGLVDVSQVVPIAMRV